MPDSVTVVASLEKLTTFASKGGGITLTVQMEDKPDLAAALLANMQKIADVTFAFRATSKKSISEDNAQGTLVDDDGVEVDPEDDESMP